MAQWPARAAPALLAFLVVVVAQLPLWWGWLADPAGRLLDNPFTGGHVWAAEVVADALWQGTWPDPTDQAGFPGSRSARFVGWAWLLVGTVLRPLVTGQAVVHLAGLLGPALGAACAVLLVRDVAPGGHPALQVAGGVLFGLSPVTLGAALSGQVENTQTWVLAGLLLLTLRAPERLWSWAIVPLAWALGALTSPYLALMAGLAAPWAGWLAWRRGQPLWRVAGPLALGAGALILVAAWLDAGQFQPEATLYRPSFQADGWPSLWGRPLPVAGLDTLLIGRTEAQVKATVLHQPYLGMVLLFGAALVGGARRRFAVPAVLGVLLALGPRLAWAGAPVTLGGMELVMPAQLVRILDLPLAHGGQYYRAAVLAHLGLAGMIAAGSLRARLALPAALTLLLAGSADALRSVSQLGVPWPTVQLPVEAWQSWQADPLPGAVLHLPPESPQLVPNHPARLAGRAVHRRAVADLPRAWTQPPQDPILAAVWGASMSTPTAQLPDLQALGDLGFRYVVVDLPPIPERVSLRKRLEAAWGQPDGRADDRVWWLATPTR